MSLISVDNAVAPFKNKVHLITILLLALLFGLYRWTGGTIKAVPRQNLARESLGDAVTDLDSEIRSGDNNKITKSIITQDDESDLLGLKTRKSIPQKVDEKKDLELDEIERSLGLR